MRTPSETETRTPAFILSRHDPLRTAILRTKLSPTGVFASVLLFNIVVNVIPAVWLGAWGTFTLESGIESRGLSGEPAAWAIFAVAQPMILAYFVWVPRESDVLFNSLLSRGTLLFDPMVAAILNGARNQMNRRWVSGAALIFACVVQGLAVFLEAGQMGSQNPTWIKVHPLVFWGRTVVALPVYYAVAILLYTWTVVIHTIDRLMRTDNIVVNPFDADRAGGLGGIGRFVGNHGFLAFAIAIAISAFYWQARIFGSSGDQSWFIASIITTGALLVIAPISFYLPLMSTHRAMLRQREKWLQVISELKALTYRQVLNACCASDSSPERGVEKLSQLEELTKLTMRFPTWPFVTEDLRKYYTLASSAPIVSFLIGVAVEWISAAYFK